MTVNSKLNLATMSDWQNLSTRGGCNLPVSFIRDAQKIISNMLTKGTASKLIAIGKLMQHHIEEDKDPHHFDIHILEEPILDALFRVYREQRLPGDRIEMLKRLFFILPIVDYSEAYLGLEDTKAVTAIKAQLQLQPHEQDLHCHYGILTHFMPKDTTPWIPTISLHDQFSTTEYYKTYITDTGYRYPTTTSVWNKYAGTLVFAFEYFQFAETQRFVECYSAENTLKLSMQLDGDSIFRVHRHGDTEEPEILFEQQVDPVEHGNRKIALSYGNGSVVIRTTLGKAEELKLDMSLPIVELVLPQPFFLTDNKSRTESFVYYPFFTDSNDILAFLVD